MQNIASTLRFRRGIAGIFLFMLLSLLATSRASAQGGGTSIRMVAPTGGEILVADSTFKIRWLVQGNITGTLYIEYSIDSGAVWKPIDTATAHTGVDSLAWKVPNDTTTKALLRVRNADSSKIGVTRRAFRISSVVVPIIRVFSPNGGEMLAVGSTFQVKWFAQNYTGPMTVEYSADSAKSWKPIGTGTTTGGLDSLAWLVPDDTTRVGLVRVYIPADSNAGDRSDRVFSIRGNLKPVLKVVAPNGGETFTVDSTARIMWQEQDLTGTIRIEYSADSGKTWTMVTVLQVRNRGLDSTSWKVAGNATTTGLIRITNAGSGLGDTSDAVFTVIGGVQPKVDLLGPLGGGVYEVDSLVTIRWSTLGITQGIMVEYTLDNFRWRVIDTIGVHAGVDSLVWRVPDSVTTTGYFRVGTRDASIRAKSTTPFSIVPKSIDTVSSVALSRSAAGARGVTAAPNPTNGAIDVRWMQGVGGEVAVDLFGSDGRLLRSTPIGRREAGAQATRLDLGDLPAGVYHVQLRSGAERASLLVTLVR